MDPGAYDEMAELEDHHWWFRGKRRLITPLLQRALAGIARPRVVDVGCGTGSNLSLVRTRFPEARLVGVDLDAGALGYSNARGDTGALVQATGLSLPFATDSVDLVVALDFIEHVDDDAALLREFRRVLKPGGTLVASVPAYPSLWSPHDDFLHHKRRYKSGELEQRLAATGFDVERRQGFNFVLLPVIAAVRFAKSRSAGDAEPEGTDFFRLPGPLEAILNGAMACVFAFEALAVRILPIRFGVSLMVRARTAGS